MKDEARVFRALADPIRVRVAMLLAVRGETCVGDMARVIGEPEFKISRHLSVLRAARLVDVRRDGTWMFYRLAQPRTHLERALFAFFRDGMSQHPTIAEDVARLRGALGDGRKAQKEAEREERRYRVLFLGEGNSCRSQMAEGWAKSLHSEKMEVYSAGIEKHGLNRRAVRAMAESDVDISGQRPKTVGELPIRDFDCVVTLSTQAYQHCPRFPGETTILQVPFDDPPALAEGAATEEKAMAYYRRVRDEIQAYIETFPAGSLPR